MTILLLRDRAAANFWGTLLLIAIFASSSFRPIILPQNHPRFSSMSAIKNPWTANDADLLHRRYKEENVIDSDYIVIGSGIGGLWLAACLSKFNYTVTVLEQHSIAGGFQHSFRRGPYEFVPGLHYIANLELCRPLYEAVATETDPPLRFHQAGFAVEADLGSSHELAVGDMQLQVRPGIENVRKELHRVFPDDTVAIDRFLSLTEKVKWQAGQFATFRIFPKPLQWILSQFMCSNYLHYASLTTEQVLDGLHITDGRLKTVLSAFGGDLGESLAEGSFVMQAAVLGHVLEGCYYPEGGPLQFVRGLIPTIQRAGGDVLTEQRVREIVVENNRAVGVRLQNGVILRSRGGVASDAGMRSTLRNLLPPSVVDDKLSALNETVEQVSGGISHVFLFVGLNASTKDLGLRSSSFYYIPWNETDSSSMNATAIQDFYRDTLLDPTVMDVSAGMVFCTAKDPVYSAATMPNRSTVIVFSEARAEDFLPFLREDTSSSKQRHLRTDAYKTAKKLIELKLKRSLLLNFPQLKPHVDWVEVGTPLTVHDYTLRTETLGLRHHPDRMTNLDLRPDCAIDGLFFTGQDVAFSGWAGAMAGSMVTAQCILNYTLADFAGGKTLLRDLGYGHVEDMIQGKVQQATAASPWQVASEIFGNAVRHMR